MTNIIKNSSLLSQDSIKNDPIITPIEKKQGLLIDNYLTQLFSEVTAEDTQLITELMVENINAAKNFIDKIIIKERQNISIRILNYNNFQALANILISISLLINTEDQVHFEFNFAIIYLAERTYYIHRVNNKVNYKENKDTISNQLNNNKQFKLYLCMLLSKNKLYLSKDFWIDLINLKIDKLIQERKGILYY